MPAGVKLRRRSRPRPTLLRDLVWRCHFCDRERPDVKIRTVQAKRVLGLANVPVTHSRRYCADRRECVEAAFRWEREADDYGRIRGT
jgi:hypothetical protein